MAIDSLYCAYLKAHHTYEFYEVLLQVFSDKGKKDKVQALKQEMLTAFGIKEGEYKFGIDNRHFVADKEKGVIYPSLLSIKGLSQGCADELYELSQNNTFDNFYDLWKVMNDLPSLNSAKIDTLIKMDYFKNYGSMDKIQKFVRAIELLHGKSQFKKDKIPAGFEEIIKKHTEETEKMYRKFNYEAALKETWDLIPNTEPSISKIIHYQNELYGYVSYRDSSRPFSAAIIDIDTRYSTFKAKLYRLSDGQVITTKLKRKTYEQMPIAVGMVIDYRVESKPAWRKDENDRWVQDYSREDLWLTHYTIE